jgi:hypothetical protein
VREKKKKKYNFHKGFYRKKSPKFDNFTTFHFKENKIKITKFRLKGSNISSKEHSEVSKKILLFSRTCIAKYG